MTWRDARTVAGAIARDVVAGRDPLAEMFLCRAEQVRTGAAADLGFDDPTAVIRALVVAARMLGS
jgi:hypothetical protein